MVLFCVCCDKKAEYNYPNSVHPMYCEYHKRERMKKITLKPRPTRNSTQTPARSSVQMHARRQKSCLICDLDFSTNELCSRCERVENKMEKLIIKYIQTHLPKTGLSLYQGDHNTVVTSNFMGDARTKLLDLESMFQTDKVLLVNFILDVNRPETFEDALAEGLEVVKFGICKKITKSEVIVFEPNFS